MLKALSVVGIPVLPEAILGILLDRGYQVIENGVKAKADLKQQRRIKRTEQESIQDKMLRGLTSRLSDSFTQEELQNFVAQDLVRELEPLIGHLYAHQLFGLNSDALATLKQSFVRSRSAEQQEARQRVFEFVLEQVGVTFRQLLDSHHPEVLRDLDAARFNALHSHISELRVLLNKGFDIDEALKFPDIYQPALEKKVSIVNPPFFDRRFSVPLEAIYVLPHLVEFDGSEVHAPTSGFLNPDPEFFTEFGVEVSLADIIDQSPGSVILGNPGAGKSSLSKKLCLSAMANLLHSPRLPFLVTLRNHNFRTHPSLIDAILKEIEALQITVSRAALSYILHTQSTLIIFDGLDELTESSLRADVVSYIEAFQDRHPEAHIVITSRIVGYDKAPVEKDSFAEYAITPFSPEQVADYAQRWFKYANPDINANAGILPSFLSEIQGLQDIVSNPLLLSLTCNIYNSSGYIPRNRHDLYAKCSELMFEHWDTSRGIAAPFPYGALSQLVGEIAYYLYDRQNGFGTSINERNLLDICKQHYIRKIPDESDAEVRAKKFVEFCVGRAWVFSDTGSTERGQRIFEFNHRTFLEYFTAKHLVRILRTTDTLMERLWPKITEGQWEIVSHVAIQIYNREAESAGNDIMDFILHGIHRIPYSRQKSHILGFTSEAMRYLDLTADRAQAATHLLMEAIFSQDLYRQGLNGQILENLLLSNPESSHAVQTSMIEILQNKENWKLSVVAYLRLNCFPENNHLPQFKNLLDQTIDSLQIDTPAVSERLDVRCLALVTNKISLGQFLRGRRPVNLLRAIPVDGMRASAPALINDLLQELQRQPTSYKPIRWNGVIQEYFDVSPDLMFTWVTLADRREFNDIDINLRTLINGHLEVSTPSKTQELFVSTLIGMMLVDFEQRREEETRVISQSLQGQLREMGLSKHLRFLRAWERGDLVLIAGRESAEIY